MKDKIECIDQGDVRFIPVPKGTKLPGQKPAAKHKTAVGEAFIVAHSETGHHHVVRAEQATMFESDNPFLALLELPTKLDTLSSQDPKRRYEDLGAPQAVVDAAITPRTQFAEIVNLRELRPHAPALLDPSYDYVVSRQTEWQPESLRAAAD